MTAVRAALVAVAVALIVTGLILSAHWLYFLALGLLLIAVVLDPRRGVIARRRTR